MRLKAYKSKRNLKKSPEPKAVQTSSSSLNFVIQKHAATHLHYDVRLEYKGVLVSWAVPKQPSLNPADKRLAIKVEDHPLDYQYFEGVIPKGNYGAGSVEIWDHGTYSGDLNGLKKGHFVVTLHGEKLQGDFVFQKLKKDSEDNNWLFFKREDAHAQSKKKVPMPKIIHPMLATQVQEPFNDENWLFEIKWDGYRTLAFIEQGKVSLKSRSNKLLNKKFPSVVKELEKLRGDLILDGEVVVLDSEGKSHFQLLQNYEKGALYYYVFDLLYKEGEDLRELPLLERKELLKDLLKEVRLPHICYSDHLVKNGELLFKEASKKHLEGIMGKKMASPYQPRRSSDWVKIKTVLRQEAVIGGFTAPRGSRKLFGALLVGGYDEEHNLNFAGHVGGGFDAARLKEVYQKLKPLIQKQSPFKTPPKTNAPVTWVKPEILCEVTFTEWTKEQRMRHPIFHGLREDKATKKVKKEVVYTNLDKIYWPKEKYTKGDLLDYYKSIAPFILPYLKNRPIMLHRYPEGVEKPGFYQKDLETTPKGVKTCPVEHEGKIVHYLLINDLQSLLYAINLGSIDLHPFMGHGKTLDSPDYCVIDLDPHGVPFTKVVEVALAFHELLKELKITHCCKTSGGNGFHIFIPLHGKYDFEQSRQFATVMAHYIQKQFPRHTSLERSPEKREKKIYLDCLQNRTGQTVVAPYAVRPRPHALVSTPLQWDEVTLDLDPRAFTIKTVPNRLKEKGDPFKAILGKGVDIKAVLNRLENL